MTVINSPWLTKLRYEPISTGVFHGHYALQGILTPNSNEGDPERQLELLETILKHPAAKVLRKIFRLTLDGLIGEENVFRAFNFCEALQGYGWEIQLVFDGFSLPAATVREALTSTQWVIIKTSSNIIAYGSNELWYLPKAPEGLKDPTMPLNKGTVLYLGTKDFEEVQVLDFLARSKYDWNILL